MNKPPERLNVNQEWQRIFCKMCKRATKHMFLGERVAKSVQWKCMECGEYNSVPFCHKP